MEEIHTMSGINLADLRDAAEYRNVWRKLNVTIAIGLTETTAQGDKVRYLALYRKKEKGMQKSHTQHAHSYKYKHTHTNTHAHTKIQA